MDQVQCPSCEDGRQDTDKLQGLYLGLKCTDGYPVAFFQGNTQRIDLIKWLMYPSVLKGRLSNKLLLRKMSICTPHPGSVPVCLPV